MVVVSKSRRSWTLFLFLTLVVSACAPAIETEPPAEPATAVPAAPTTSALAAYPAAPTATPTPLPYPWPTHTPRPTDPPEPTEEPTETPPPFPTRPPTPVVTPIPTAAPPFIPFPEGTTAQPFTLYYRDGDVIHSLRSEGQAEASLFLDPAAEFSLHLTPEEAYLRSWGALSPDGRSFALVLSDAPQTADLSSATYPVSVYLLDLESRELRLLVKDGVEPVWSPDGKRLAYRSTETGGLWVADVAGGEAVEVYAVDRANGHNVTDYSWAPDSRRLAVLDEVFYEPPDLFIVDAEQELGPRLLIDGAPGNWVYNPEWSPKGDQIAFIWGIGGRSGGPFPWIANLGGEERQLMDDIYAGGGPARWSPDGRWIAYAGTAFYEPVQAQIDLWLIDSIDASRIRLTYDEKQPTNDENANDVDPMWSLDGTQIVFSKGQEVWSLSLINGGKRKLFASPESYNIGLVIGR